MNKEKRYKTMIYGGMGLFLSTFVFHFDISLKTSLILGGGFGMIIGGLTSLIDLKQSVSMEESDEIGEDSSEGEIEYFSNQKQNVLIF